MQFLLASFTLMDGDSARRKRRKKKFTSLLVRQGVKVSADLRNNGSKLPRRF
jgi:hypothetical protein